MTFCPAQATASAKASPRLFEFHSGFWINLHHFLYVMAAPTDKLPRATAMDAAETQRLSPSERACWDAALAYYAEAMAGRDLLFDEGMIRIKNQLEDAEATSDLADAAIPTELKRALLSAAPIYRKHWWRRHDAENRRWIAQLHPLVKQYGPGLAEALGRTYESPWPDHPVRVDAVVYANWAGAYTSLTPARPTISTTDPANQGPAALEVLIHETSHGMVGKVEHAIAAEEDALIATPSKRFPHEKSLWHEVLFYTAGELVAERISGYVPYADKNGLWVRAWPGPDRSLLEKDWKPHVNGAVPLSTAVAKLIRDLVAALPPG